MKRIIIWYKDMKWMIELIIGIIMYAVIQRGKKLT